MRYPDFPIESGVPMPKEKGRYCKYPWRVMEVGDSFFVPHVDRGNLVTDTFAPSAPDLNLKLHRLRALITYQHRKHPEHFEVRVVDGGVRVWRTK